MLITLPFDSHSRRVDDADAWGVWQERGLRELRWRAEIDETETGELARSYFSLLDAIPARDAGDVCHVCGEIVSWFDHLPPLSPGLPVRCFSNVVVFERYRCVR